MAEQVFINVPYDKQFEGLYLAYLVGITMLGFSPRPAVALPNNKARLSKIIQLIDECAYSIHDLSRVQLSKSTGLPRFNMPIELGFALYRSLKGPEAHGVFIFDSEPYRVQKAASDLNGFDIQNHKGTAKGVMTQLRDSFDRQSGESTVPEMLGVLADVRKVLPRLKKDAGATTIFDGAAIASALTLAISSLKSDRELSLS